MEHDVVLVAKNLDFEFVKRFENSKGVSRLGQWTSFWQCFSRGLPGAPFCRLFSVLGVPGGLVVELPGAPWGTLILKGFCIENRLL